MENISNCQCCKRIFTTKDELTQEWFCFYCDESNNTQWKCSQKHVSNCGSFKYRYRMQIKTKNKQIKMYDEIKIPILSCPCCKIVFKNIDPNSKEWFCADCESDICLYSHENSISAIYSYRYVASFFNEYMSFLRIYLEPMAR